jgi:hypothetical protein
LKPDCKTGLLLPDDKTGYTPLSLGGVDGLLLFCALTYCAACCVFIIELCFNYMYRPIDIVDKDLKEFTIVRTLQREVNANDLDVLAVVESFLKLNGIVDIEFVMDTIVY